VSRPCEYSTSIIHTIEKSISVGHSVLFHYADTSVCGVRLAATAIWGEDLGRQDGRYASCCKVIVLVWMNSFLRCFDAKGAP
jgi:hypothetical protein